MINLKEKKISDELLIKACIYGSSGTKKTTLSGTFPPPLFMFDFDHKYDVLFGTDIEVESFNCLEPTEFDRFWQLHMKIRRDPKYARGTLIYDSASNLDMLILMKMIKLGGRIPTQENVVGQIDDYKRLNKFYKTMIIDLMSTQVQSNVCFIGHERYLVDEDSKLHKIGPLITGQAIMDQIPGTFQETWHMVTQEVSGKVHYLLNYRPRGKAIASSLLLKGNGIMDLGEHPSYQQIRKEIVA